MAHHITGGKEILVRRWGRRGFTGVQSKAGKVLRREVQQGLLDRQLLADTENILS